jgi:succinate dehydrogenase / fumarate reductase cytochrome b subunit
MGWIGGFYRSTIGRKIVMAVSGIVLVVYVVGHMTGNLLAFQGRARLDGYAHFLQSSAPILWTVRTVLLLATILHIHSAYSLTHDARAARPAGYARRDVLISTVGSRTMRWGGVLLLVFIVYHILHFTTGTVHPDFVRGQVYDNLVTGLRVPAVAVFYLLAMLALALHLSHGAWSLFQTLGLTHPRLERGRRGLAVVLAIVVPAGFAAIPLAVLLGWLR